MGLLNSHSSYWDGMIKLSSQREAGLGRAAQAAEDGLYAGPAEMGKEVLGISLEDFTGIHWDLMGFSGDLMGFCGDFNGDLWWFNGM